MVSRGVVVTGGLGGIGMAVARHFAAEGASILLVDARADDGAARASLLALGAARVESAAVDVSDEKAVAASIDQALALAGRLDVIVNVAGMMIYKPLADVSADDWHRVLGVNLVGAALYTGHALRRMAPGGCVVNVASVHARRTTALVGPYAAAKAGLVSLTRTAAIEGKPLGIRVNAVLPGAVDTAMLRDSPAIRSGAEVLDEADVGQPDDIAAVVAFLASPQAKFITGEDVVADAGRMGRL